MKKLLATIVLSLSLTSCAEVADGLRDISQGTFLTKRIGNPFNYGNMPSYEFYEKLSETDNAQVVLPILEKNLTTIENEKAFQFSSNLVNESTFSWFTPNDIFSFNNKVDYSKELNNNKIKSISFYFSHVLNFSKTNFYKVFNLNSNDVSITQLKKHCESYRRILPFINLLLRMVKHFI
ncbi:hypothetical protein ACNO7P_10835 [Bisgaard Taxon 45]